MTEPIETPTLVVDVKYKPGSGPKRDDLNQIIPYGLSYRARNVAIIQPAGEGVESGLKKLGTIGTLSVYCYLFNLNAEDIEAEERRMCAAIADVAI